MASGHRRHRGSLYGSYGHDLTKQLDRKAVALRVHEDALDQAEQDAECLVAHCRFGDRLVQPLDLAAIEPGEVWVQARSRGRSADRSL